LNRASAKEERRRETRNQERRVRSDASHTYEFHEVQLEQMGEKDVTEKEMFTLGSIFVGSAPKVCMP